MKIELTVAEAKVLGLKGRTANVPMVQTKGRDIGIKPAGGWGCATVTDTGESIRVGGYVKPIRSTPSSPDIIS